MTKRNLIPLLLVATMLCGLLSGCANGATGATATPTPGAFVPFDVFLARVANATFDEYARVPGAQVQEPQAFEAMRTYIQQMYTGVQQVSSFVLEGAYVDCITIASQPSVRQLGLTTIENSPPAVVAPQPAGGADPGKSRPSPSLLTLGRTDPFGHPIACTDGTIPMQRLTLEKLVTFKTLQEFLAKAPDGQVFVPPVPDQPNAPESADHRYAVGVQTEPNTGGGSRLSLWNPNSKFAISQQWYMGGSESSSQTVEGGLLKYPHKFGSKAVLFIYWTRSNYSDGNGCYNLECAGFVQTNSHWYLGGPWDNYSAIGGTQQWHFDLDWELSGDNWWLYLQGPGEPESVGYLPTKVFKGGALATAASGSAYGGETSNLKSGAFPPMGSGEFASGGWESAAFQTNIFYVVPSNVAMPKYASLRKSEPSPACYTIDLQSGGYWGTYFFFDGPGGSPC
jgi:Neprosin